MIFEKEGRELPLEEFEKLTGTKWIPKLEFKEPPFFKRELTREQIWLGKYFKKELTTPFTPNVAIRWIDLALGWGVFASKDLKKMEFIAEYTGKVRKRRKADAKNAYCFEYIAAPGYIVDALDQGGVARYINHSYAPNLVSALAILDGISHIIFYAKEPIAKGTQLCYDYGPDYWSKRTAPISL